MKTIGIIALLGLSGLAVACAPQREVTPRVPAYEYVRGLSYQLQLERQLPPQVAHANVAEARAGWRSVSNQSDGPSFAGALLPADDMVSNMTGPADVYIERSALPQRPEYSGPLALGDPGMTASLWQQGRSGNNLFDDGKALRPMDLITILVTDRTDATEEAATDTKGETSIQAALNSFLGIERSIGDRNSNMDFGNLIDAETTNEFKSKTATNRRGRLTGTISAMVIEVLPSGVVRVAGEKIVTVNNEEQIMVISGLVRPRDISADNEVDSNKIAQLRVDYFGKGILAENQSGGWMQRFLAKVWPF